MNFYQINLINIEFKIFLNNIGFFCLLYKVTKIKKIDLFKNYLFNC